MFHFFFKSWSWPQKLISWPSNGPTAIGKPCNRKTLAKGTVWNLQCYKMPHLTLRSSATASISKLVLAWRPLLLLLLLLSCWECTKMDPGLVLKMNLSLHACLSGSSLEFPYVDEISGMPWERKSFLPNGQCPSARDSREHVSGVFHLIERAARKMCVLKLLHLWAYCLSSWKTSRTRRIWGNWA